MIYSCLCSVCKKFHSHCYPNPKKKGTFICVNCLHKQNLKEIGREVEDGRGKEKDT
jgi:hypothetical protein